MLWNCTILVALSKKKNVKSTNTKLTSYKISNVNYPDNILEMFENTNLEIEDLDDELYNYPLIMPQKPNNKKNKHID